MARNIEGPIAPMLEVKNLSKRFGVVQALDKVNFDLWAGEVHALVGENGAGKSTLVRILSGILQPDEGAIFLDGEERLFQSSRESQGAGIATIHQELSLVPTMTVQDNLLLGYEPKRSGQFGRLDLGMSRRKAFEALGRIDAEIPLDSRVDGLSTAEQQTVEIARAVDRAARVLIMDEPTARLTRVESERLFKLIAELRRANISVIYISHRLGEIWEIADRITVLRDGSRVASSTPDSTTQEQLIQHMSGTETNVRYPDRVDLIGEVALDVQGLTNGEEFQGVSLNVRCGEIVGVVGLVGSGRKALAPTIFGSSKPSEGAIYIHGKIIDDPSPAKLINEGVALVPEKQIEEGLFPPLDLTTNITMPILQKFSHLGFLQVREQTSICQRYMDKLAIQAPTSDTPVEKLSGGNRQKTIIARWLSSGSNIYLMDEATAGVDVETKFQLYRLLYELASEGAAILWISSDLAEVIGLCDRILVMASGTLVQEVSSNTATEGTLLAAMFGHPNDQ